MSNRRDIQFTFNPHNKLTMLDCSITVDVANVNGFGASALNRSGRIAYVFMHSTSAFTGTSHTSTLIDSISSTANLKVGMPVQGSGIAAGTKIASIVDGVSITLSAATSSSTTGSITYQAVGSPNPAAGYIYVQLQDNYNSYLYMNSNFTSPNSGSSINVTTGVTAGLTYVITALGSTTTAQWNVLGVPVNITPAVGVAFVAPITTTATGTGTIQVNKSTGSGVDHIEIIGNPTVMNSNGNFVSGSNVAIGANGFANGMQLIGVCMKNTAITQPADGTIINLDIALNNTAQGV